MVSHSVEGATFFACMDWRHLVEVVSAIRALGCVLLNLCVWVKTNGGMGSLYGSRHQLVSSLEKATQRASTPSGSLSMGATERTSGTMGLRAAAVERAASTRIDRQAERDGQ